MKNILFAILLSSCLFLLPEAFAQKSSSKKKKAAQKEIGSSAQKNVGIGLRVGDPLGLTLKKYFGDKLALEFNLGKTFFWGSGYDGYYRYNDNGNFNGAYPYYYNGNPYYNNPPGNNYPGNPYPGNPYTYNGYYYYDPRAVSMQLHLLAQKSIPSVQGLQLYFGAGPQLRILAYKYGYYYNTPVGPRYYEENYTQAGFGLDGVFGTEYTFSSIPMTVFADLNLYVEIAKVPLWIGVQGGIGARFNF